MKGRFYGGCMRKIKIGIFLYFAIGVLCCRKEKGAFSEGAVNSDTGAVVEEIQEVSEEVPLNYWEMPPKLTSIRIEEAVSGINMALLTEDDETLIKDRLLGKLVHIPGRGTDWWYVVDGGNNITAKIHYTTIDDVRIFVFARPFKNGEEIFSYDICESVLVYPHYGKELWIPPVEGMPGPRDTDPGEFSVLGLITFTKYAKPPENERKHYPPEVLVINNITGEMKVEENTDNRYEVFLSYGVPYRYEITPEILLSDWKAFGKTASGINRLRYFKLRRENDIYTITYRNFDNEPALILVESGTLEMNKEIYTQSFREYVLTTINSTFTFRIYPFDVYYEDDHPVCFMTASFVPEGDVGYVRKCDIIRPYSPDSMNPNILTWMDDISFITDDNVQLREGPGTSEAVIKMLKKEEIVEFLEISEGQEFIDGYYDHWYKIKTRQGDIGWVYGMYLSFPSHPK
jgi:hypothetical protein